MVIKIDVDGVIRNMFEEMCEVYNQQFNDNVKVEDIYDYRVDEVFTKVREELHMSAHDYFFKKHSRRMFLDSKPYDGVCESINKLRDAGHKVVIVTWQFNLENKMNTLLFLDKHNIQYDDICFTKDKWMVYGDWMIDDNLGFILDEREKSRKILVDMPYNRNVENEFVIRVNNIVEAVDIILGEKKISKSKVDDIYIESVVSR